MLEGTTFNFLTVVRRAGVGKNKAKFALYLFKCICGVQKIAAISEVRRGRVKSCGCRTVANINNFKHGYSRKLVYGVWRCMKGRMLNPKDRGYPRYGGRGLKLCKRWHKFENFLADMGEPPAIGYSLDRIDNNRGYCKSNCKWSTEKEQQRNSSNNIMYTLHGKRQCLSAWAEEFNIPYRVVWDRIRRSNWDLLEALTTPKRKRVKNIVDKVT